MSLSTRTRINIPDVIKSSAQTESAYRTQFDPQKKEQAARHRLKIRGCPNMARVLCRWGMRGRLLLQTPLRLCQRCYIKRRSDDDDDDDDDVTSGDFVSCISLSY